MNDRCVCAIGPRLWGTPARERVRMAGETRDEEPPIHVVKRRWEEPQRFDDQCARIARARFQETDRDRELIIRADGLRRRSLGEPRRGLERDPRRLRIEE